MMRVAFIGLGNMGGGMAANQAKARREVAAFDLSAAALDRAAAAGCSKARSAAEAVKSADAVVTMLPAGSDVRRVYAEQILPNAPRSAILVDSSTIDVESARAVAVQAKAAGFSFADAPVSGGHSGGRRGHAGFYGRLRRGRLRRLRRRHRPHFPRNNARRRRRPTAATRAGSPPP